MKRMLFMLARGITMSTSDERLTKLEVSVGVLDTKMDATGKKLMFTLLCLIRCTL